MRHGSNIDPPNRFEAIHLELDADIESDPRRIEYLEDASKSIVSENRSPDLPFRYSINPYRGCVHGCSYCYVRPTHEYLGLNAGLDFETKIIVKRNAPQLFREFLGRPAWRGEPIAMSGVTDCYQPAERSFRLTRQCIEIAQQCGQSLTIVTKNALITRDIDLIAAMAKRNLVHVNLSITTLDSQLARDMEPRTSIPAARLRAIGQLADAGVPVGVMVAPMIPGLNDHETAEILKEAKAAGAIVAGYVLLRLPSTVETVFCDWLKQARPQQAEKIIGRIEHTRDGKRNSSQFGTRMIGEGKIAEQIRAMFHLFRQQAGLNRKMPPLDQSVFQPPSGPDRQMRLF